MARLHSGTGNTAKLSGSGFGESRAPGNGATNQLPALSGTTSSVIQFGAVRPEPFDRIIQSEFTVCSVTRYTGGAKQRILQTGCIRYSGFCGNGADWFHGHHGDKAGVAFYQDGWKTAVQNNVSPDTDWVVMCGTNAGLSQLKLANGVDVGIATGGSFGGTSLVVNAGVGEYSDFAIAEVAVWPRGLTEDEMRRASKHLMNGLLARPPAVPTAYPAADMLAWYCPGAFDLASKTWQDCSGKGNTAALLGSGFAESRGAGHGATNSELVALSGTTSSVIAFGAVIPSAFTVCSVTRYTLGP